MNIEYIISEIRENIKKNPKYIHPCNKEFQEDIKKYKFESGYDYITWMQNNGILRNPIEFNREHHRKTYEKYGCNGATEYMNLCAQKVGYKDRKERRNEYEWNNGIRFPTSENKDYHSYSGVEIAQKKVAKIILPMILGSIKQEMEHNNPGFDFLMEGDIKVDIKSAKLATNNWNLLGWLLSIDYNNIADYFLFVGFNYQYNNIPLEVLYLWLIHKDEIIGERKLWRRDGLWINKKYISEFCKYELKDELLKFKEICPILDD